MHHEIVEKTIALHRITVGKVMPDIPARSKISVIPMPPETVRTMSVSPTVHWAVRAIVAPAMFQAYVLTMVVRHARRTVLKMRVDVVLTGQDCASQMRQVNARMTVA